MTTAASEIAPFGDGLFYDRIAQEINAKLESMFDDQYPVCWTRTENEETIPEVYLNDGTKVNLRVMPNDSRSMSFFTVEGDLIELDEDYFEIPMAITCWFNLQEYNSKQYDYTSELIRTVYNVLKDYGAYDMNVNVNTPFENFSMLAKVVDENTMRPYSAFKISFVKTSQICVP